MAVHQVFYGGDHRRVGQEHSRRTSFQSDEIRYAGHTPTRHWSLPFEYDGGTTTWQEYAAMHGPFATGDVVYTHALAKDSRVQTLVIHNKKPAGVKDKDTGAVTTAAKVKFALYDGETKVDETEEIDLSAVGRTIVEFGKPTNAKGTTKKDTNDDGKVDKKDQPETFISSLGAYLGNNGTVRMEVVAGDGFNSVCLEAYCEVVDFRQVHGCTCVAAPCESEYPDPQCR